jgi:hypothetical protein
VVAWAVPAGVTPERVEEVAPAAGQSYLVPALVLVGLVVFIAIVVLILYLG